MDHGSGHLTLNVEHMSACTAISIRFLRSGFAPGNEELWSGGGGIIMPWLCARWEALWGGGMCVSGGAPIGDAMLLDGGGGVRIPLVTGEMQFVSIVVCCTCKTDRRGQQICLSGYAEESQVSGFFCTLLQRSLSPPECCLFRIRQS